LRVIFANLKIMKSIYLSLVIIFFGLPFLFSEFHFESRENDSRLYTIFVEQLSEKPLSHLAALEWRHMSAYTDESNPYVRDHLVGQFIPSVIMAKLGWNPKYSHYVINQLYRFLIPLFFYYLFQLYFSKEAALLVLVSSHLSLISFNYVFRANQELPLLFGLVLAMIGKAQFTQINRYSMLFYFSNLWTFLVKGFAGLIHLPFWALQSMKSQADKKKEFIIFFVLFLCLLATAGLYEVWFKNLTGTSFWEGYVQIQVLGRNPEKSVIFSSLPYYLSRSLSYSLPWCFGLYFIFKLLKEKKFSPEQKSFIYSNLAIIASYLIFFGFFSRKASRYIFPAYFLIIALGATGIGYKTKEKYHRFLKNKLIIHSTLYWSIFTINFIIFLIGGKQYS